MKFFSYFDCFASNPYVFIIEERKNRTVLGGCLSILMFMILVVIFFVYLTQDVISQNPKIFYEDKYTNYKGDFKLKCPIFLTFSNNSFIENSQINIFLGENRLDLKEIKVENCSLFLDQEHFLLKNDYNCLKIDRNASLWNNSLQIIIYSPNELNVNLIFWDAKPNMFSLVKHEISNTHKYKTTLKPKQQNNLNFYFKKTEILFDKNIFLSEFEQEDIYTLEKTKEKIEIMNNESEILLQINFMNQGYKSVLFKSVSTTWINVLSTFGGLFYLFYNLFRLLCKPLMKFLSMLQILEDLIDFKLIIFDSTLNSNEKKFVKICLQNPISEERIDDRKIVKNFNNEEIFNLKQREKPIIDDKLSDIRLVKSQLLKSDELCYFKLPHMRKVKANYNFRTFFIYFTNIYPKFKRHEHECLNNGFDKIKEILNLRLILNQINELEILKSFILDKNQMALFNKFQRISIEILEKSHKIVDGKTFTFNNLDWKTVDERVIEAYKTISTKNPRSKINTKILDLIDCEAKKILNKLIIE